MIKCNLCYQQNFESVVDLKEHLIDSIFGPLTCSICKLAVKGIQDLIHHLDIHIGDNITNNLNFKSNEKHDFESLSSFHGYSKNLKEVKFVNQDFKNSEQKIYCNVSICKPSLQDQFSLPIDDQRNAIKNALNKTEQLHTNFGSINNLPYKSLSPLSDKFMRLCEDTEHKKLLDHSRTSLSNTPDKVLQHMLMPGANLHSEINEKFIPESDNKTLNDSVDMLDLEKSNLEFQHVSDEGVRAFVCIHCGSKVVGKDMYFKHLLVCRNPKGKAANSLSSKECLLDDSILTKKQIENYETHNSLVKVTSLCMKGNANYEMRNRLPQCNKMPYIHKKFDQDQGRKVSSVVRTDIQCSIQNFQSILVTKLNNAIECNNNETVCLEKIDSKNNLDNQSNQLYTNVTRIPLLNESPTQDNSDLNVKEINIKDKLEKCHICFKTFSKVWSLKRHLEERHSTQNSFECTFCSKAFKSKRFLLNHLSIHKLKSFLCKSCNYSCSTKSGLRTHKYECHGSFKKFKCNICSKIMSKKYGLERHMERKHGQVLFTCKYCDKPFSCKEDLNTHSNIHSTDSEIDCLDCLKTFTTKKALKRHSLSHKTKLNKFQCNICQVEFTRKDSLAKHKKRHHSFHNFDTSSRSQILDSIE